MEIAIVIQSIS